MSGHPRVHPCSSLGVLSFQTLYLANSCSIHLPIPLSISTFLLSANCFWLTSLTNTYLPNDMFSALPLYIPIIFFLPFTLPHSFIAPSSLPFVMILTDSFTFWLIVLTHYFTMTHYPYCTFTIYMARSPLVVSSLVLLKYTWVLAKALEPLSSSWKYPFTRHPFVTSPLSHYKCSLILDITWLPVGLKQWKVLISLSGRENPWSL